MGTVSGWQQSYDPVRIRRRLASSAQCTDARFRCLFHQPPRLSVQSSTSAGLLPRCRCFNPCSPFPGSDAPSLHAQPQQIRAFQSTLPVSGKRCMVGSSLLRMIFVFQSTLPVSGERCSSPVTTGNIGTKRLHCANPCIPEQTASYAIRWQGENPH